MVREKTLMARQMASLMRRVGCMIATFREFRFERLLGEVV